MRLNADFTKRVVIRPEDYHWQQSPANSVERMMLDRIGNEVARATTIVRFSANASFDAHTHDGGEEFLVLDGTFSDETGDYGPGTYIRNPIGTRHKPFSKQGCTMLVKLHQFAAEDTQQVTLDTGAARFVSGLVAGLTVLPLHQHGTENVALVCWKPGTRFNAHRHWGGEEIFVIEGTFADEHGIYPAGSWLRNPHLSTHSPFTDEGCLIYVKTGHLGSVG